MKANLIFRHGETSIVLPFTEVNYINSLGVDFFISDAEPAELNGLIDIGASVYKIGEKIKVNVKREKLSYINFF